MKTPLYRALAQCLEAMANCRKSGNVEWLANHEERALALVREHMPSGSGIDNGCSLVVEKSDANRITFDTSYHHMDENGFYDGWTRHVVRVRASLANAIDITITGPDRNQIKEYLHDVLREALTKEVDPYTVAERDAGAI